MIFSDFIDELIGNRLAHNFQIVKDDGSTIRFN
jgi:hypothetical protein